MQRPHPSCSHRQRMEDRRLFRTSVSSPLTRIQFTGIAECLGLLTSTDSCSAYLAATHLVSAAKQM